MTPETITPEEDHRSSAEIQSDIRHTRERMDSTLDELGNRLTARSLLNTALDWWDSPHQGNQGSAAARKAAIGLARQARRHPGPALLIGGAIAWLIADARHHDDEETIELRRYRKYRAGRSRALASYAGEEKFETRGHKPGMMSQATHKTSDAMQEAKHKASDAIEGAKHRAADVMEGARETASEYGEKVHHMTDQLSEQAHEAYERGQSAIRRVTDEVKEGYHSGADRFARASEDYPLAVGTGFLALGALLGLVIPHTRREDELMGETSDHLIEGAREKAGELMETGKAMGARVMDVAKEEARAQGLTGDTLAATLSDIVDRGTEVVKKAKDEATHAAEEEGLTPSQIEKKTDDTVGSRF
jgi:gas vesicle protein